MLGDFEITLREDSFYMDFPEYLLTSFSSFKTLEEILGERSREVWIFQKDMVLAVLENDCASTLFKRRSFSARA